MNAIMQNDTIKHDETQRWDASEHRIYQDYTGELVCSAEC